MGAVLLLDYYLTPEWIDRALALLCEIRQEGYYAQMAVAWAFSMAWVKFPEKTGAYLQPGVLGPVHPEESPAKNSGIPPG